MMYKKIISVLVVHTIIVNVLGYPLLELISHNYTCDYRNIINWIYFRYSRCIQILYETNDSNSACINEIANQLTHTTVYLKTFPFMKDRNIFKTNKTNCETFLVLSTNHQAIDNWFYSIPTAGNGKFNKTDKFYPYSRLYFIFANDTNLRTLQTHLHSNALFGYNLIRSSQSGYIVSIHDLLSKAYTYKLPNVRDVTHPYINTTNPSKEFIVSTFNCSPSVMYLERIGDDYRKDGVEYRFIRSVLKNWKIRFIHQDESQQPFTPHSSMLNDLKNRTSQLVVCANWLHVGKLGRFDLTNYFDYNCNTWIVPKPMKLSAATVVYRALSSDVWLIYGFCFVLTAILIAKISQLQSKFTSTKIISTEVGRCLLEAANTATGHSTVHIPQQLPIQILFFSWILLSLLIGVGYTTVYASRLTSPSYHKPIDTIDDFVSQDIYWATRHSYRPILKTLLESNDPWHNKMRDRFTYVQSGDQLHDMLKTGKYGVLLTLLQNRKAMDIEHIRDPELWKLFRFMKTCFDGCYTTFVLNKHSPYTTLFDANMRKYQESGLIKHWFNELYMNVHWMDTLFELHVKTTSKTRILNIVDVSGGFIILLFGLGSAAIAFMGEIVVNNMKHLHQNGDKY